MKPGKFFEADPSAIPAIPAIREDEKRANPSVTQVFESKDNTKLSHKNTGIAKTAGIADTTPDFFDDRNHCHDCQKLINGRCLVDRVKPIDDIPRRCEWFVGYPVREGLK